MVEERDILRELEEPSVGEGGGVESAALSLSWGPEGVEAVRLQGPVRLDQVRLTEETLASVQLHRAWSRRPASWLQRLLKREGSVEAWLCAQLRGKRGERLRLSARMPLGVRADIQVQPREGTAVDFDDLLSVLAWARHLGARLVYMPADADDLAPPEDAHLGTEAPAVQEARAGAELEAGTLEERVLARLEARGVGDIVRRLHAMRAERAHLERELDEVEQRVSLWDRVFFFTTTPDKERARELRGEIQRLDAEIASARSYMEPIFADVAQAYPVFELGVGLSRLSEVFEDAFMSHRGHTLAGRRRRRELLEQVEALRATLFERYLPGLDVGALLAELGALERCRALAEGELPEGFEHPTLGLRPLERAEVARVVAAGLLEARFHSRRDGLPDPREAEGEEEAFFALKHRVDAALARVPALRFAQRLDAVAGAIRELNEARGDVLMASGEQGEHDALAWGAIAMEALELAAEDVRAILGVPMPWEAARRVAGLEVPARRGGLDAVMAAAVRALDGLESQRRTLRIFARRRVDDERELEGLSMPLLERLGGGSERARVLKLRLRFSREQCEHGWPWLVQQARAQLRAVRPLSLREGALVVHRGIGGMRPEGRMVHGQIDVRQAIGHLRSLLTPYGVGTSRRELMFALSQAEPRRIEIRDGSPEVFRALTPEAMVGHIAGSRDLSAWQAAYRALAEKMDAHRALQREHAARDAALEFWDIFTKDGRGVRVLRGEMRAEAQDIAARYDDVARVFQDALWAYPPAWLYLSLERVEAAAAAVHAVQSQNGASLRGVGEAQDATERWSRALAMAYGQLPSAHHLIELSIWSRGGRSR